MPFRHVCLAVFVMALWGGNFVAIRLGLQSFPPLFFSAIRFTLTALPVIFILGTRDTPWRTIIAVGVVFGIAKFATLFVGMHIGVSAGIASLVLQSQVFFTVVLAAILMKEAISVFDGVGLMTACLGIALIASQMPGFSSLVGLGLVIFAGACWAIANLIIKKAGPVNMFKLIIYMSLIPPIPMFILSMIFEGPAAIETAVTGISFTAVCAVFYVVVIGTIFGFAVWGNFLSRYPASKVAPFSLLVPVFGMSLSSLILSEQFTHYQLLGAAMVIAGLVIINVRQLLSIRRKVEIPAG